MKTEELQLKWWQEILIAVTVFSVLLVVVLFILNSISSIKNVYERKAYQRELNIIKTEYEIVKLRCGERNGSYFDQVNRRAVCKVGGKEL